MVKSISSTAIKLAFQKTLQPTIPYITSISQKRVATPRLLKRIPLASRTSWVLRSSRVFSTSSMQLKKAGKSNTTGARSDSSPPVDPTTAKQTPVDDVFDVSELEVRVLKAIERLTHELANLRQGGKLNPDLLLKLNVLVGKGEKEQVKLGDIAQVIPRGRLINVVVGEQDYIKPVITAIMASPYCLNPDQPKPDNPMTIPIPIPPPTGESRQKAVEDARTLARDADTAIQAARAGHHKKIQKLEKQKTIRPDDSVKATKNMEEVAKRGKSEVKRILEGAVKVLDQH